MNNESPNVISIGYGRNLFLPGNSERLRMEDCAKYTGEFHMVIFTHAADQFSQTKVSEKLFLHPTASRSKFTMPIDAFRIARSIIKQHKSRSFIVTTQDPFEAGLIGLLLKAFYGVRLVVQEHGDVYSTSYWRKESFLNQLRFVWGKFVLAYADTVRVVSKRTENFFRKKRYPHIVTLPVAVDTTRFTLAKPNPHVRQLFSPEHFVFLTVARFVPQKNLTMLLDAFAKVQQAHPHARLLLVGTGPEEVRLKVRTTELFGSNQSLVSFLPWSDDVPGLMKASDTYVLSSHYEGWGRVLVEAMAAQLPVVTTDVGCAGEVIQDGVHGLVVPLNETQLFAEAMMKLIADSELRTQIQNNLAAISLKDIPGTNIETYGENWVKTLLL